jgi:hypothetical protein
MLLGKDGKFCRSIFFWPNIIADDKFGVVQDSDQTCFLQTKSIPGLCMDLLATRFTEKTPTKTQSVVSEGRFDNNLKLMTKNTNLVSM